jgi:hypothetical protein
VGEVSQPGQGTVGPQKILGHAVDRQAVADLGGSVALGRQKSSGSGVAAYGTNVLLAQ